MFSMFEKGQQEMTEYEILKRALDAYGVDHQLEMLVEECAELIVSIKHWTRGRVKDGKVIEEIVDVQIMIDQMKMFFPKGTYDIIREEKIKRLDALLNKGN